MTESEAGPTRPRLLQWTHVLLAAALLLLAWTEALFVRAEALLGVLLMLAMAAAGLCHRFGPGATARSGQILAAVGVLAQATWFVTHWRPSWVLAEIAGVVLAFVGVAVAWSLRSRVPAAGLRGVAQGLARSVAWLLVGLAAIISTAILTNSMTPVPVAVALQKATGAKNDFSPRAASRPKQLAGGAILITDVRYGTRYPNSFLDIYIAPGAPRPRPTYVYVHGGGFILGEKSFSAAPGGVNSVDLMVRPMLDAGYNFVSVGYGLAPEISYPTPVIQLAEALAFLKAHGAEFGVDMSQVVLAGGSAGGQIAGQYVNIETNPTYARQMKVTPVLGSRLKAVVLDSAPFDPERAGRTVLPSAANDFLFTLALRTYLGSPERMEEASILNHVTASFPAAFIADGNVGSFADQAADAAAKLRRLGVPVTLNLYPNSEAALPHGFMALPSRWTADYNRRKIDFLRARIDAPSP